MVRPLHESMRTTDQSRNAENPLRELLRNMLHPYGPSTQKNIVCGEGGGGDIQSGAKVR
jgi:hypothetical protein